MSASFRGIVTPLITPVTPDGEPDLASLARLVEFQVESGAHGLWAMGTSSEFAAFDADERAMAVETVVNASAGRIPVIANISDAATRLAIGHGKRAVDAGAVAVAATPPYYYPHSQDELIAHFSALHDALSVPLFIYNIPQTVRVRVELATAQRLAADGIAHGIKDSQNDLEWFRQLSLFVRERGIAFSLFAGTRHLIDAAVLAGADGAIPSLANAFPRLCVRVYEAAAAGEYARAAELECDVLRLESLNLGLGGSRNAATLGVLKAILQARGVISHRDLTRPLRNLTDEERQRVVDCAEGMYRE